MGDDFLDLYVPGAALTFVESGEALLRGYEELRPRPSVLLLKRVENRSNNSFTLLVSEVRTRVHVIDASREEGLLHRYVLHEISLNIHKSICVGAKGDL